MAEFGYEGQESTISAMDCKKSDSNVLERKIYVNNLEGLTDILHSCSITDYTINVNKKVVSVLSWGIEEEDKIDTLITKLKQYEYYKKDTEKYVDSRYLGRSERAELYQGWLQDGTRISQVAGTEDEDREQYRGVPEVGLFQSGGSVVGLRQCSSQSTWPSSFDKDRERRRRRADLLCRTVREAARRLKDEDYFLGKPDFFLRDIESEMLRDEIGFLKDQVDNLTSEMSEIRTELARVLAENSDYKGRYAELIHNPDALAEFCNKELKLYEEGVLSDICDRLNKTFANGPFKGLGVSLEFPPFIDGKPVPDWKHHGIIKGFSVETAEGKTVEWSIEKGSLDAKGNHITPDGSFFNIYSGTYSQTHKKMEGEWNKVNKTVRSHRR